MPLSHRSVASPTAHSRVLRAAGELFLKNGYQVSMDAVALRARVSKQTVYAHFSNKALLFRAAVDRLVKPMHAHLQAQPLEGSLAEILLSFAEAHQRHILTRQHIELERILITEATRMPAAARQFYRVALAELQRPLMQRMVRGMDRNEIRRDDPEVAAEVFLAMLKGLEGDRRLLGVRGRGSKAQDAWARHAVALFFKAYAPAASAEGAPSTSDLVRTEST